MRQRDPEIIKSILYSRVNFWLGATLLVVFALSAGLTVWHALTGLNPIVSAMASQMQQAAQ